jgi:hypothetical protein
VYSLYFRKQGIYYPPLAGAGCSIKEKVGRGGKKLSRIVGVQECDARDNDSSNAVG